MCTKKVGVNTHTCIVTIGNNLSYQVCKEQKCIEKSIAYALSIGSSKQTKDKYPVAGKGDERQK